MRENRLLAVAALLLLPGLGGCVVSRAISAGAVADNLAVERAQNEMLLLNVLRGKDHRPMYVTGISKITGSIKAEASLNATAPFGSVQSDRPASLSAPYFVGSPTATYNWNPSFDVDVLDTSEFMRGFLAPVSSDVFAYYWQQGFYPEFLFHLMVQKVEVKVEHAVCDTDNAGSRKVDEYVIFNNHEGGGEPVELERFTQWVSRVLEAHPHFEEGKPEAVGPPLSAEDAGRALIRGLQPGLNLAQVGKQYQFQRDPQLSLVLKLDDTPTLLKDLYAWTADAYRRDPAGMQLHTYSEAYSAEADADGCPSPESAGEKAAAPRSFPIEATASTRGFTEAGLIRLDGDPSPARMTLTLYLRSPEAILYYLGELARFEESTGKALYVCMHDTLEPLFVVRRGGVECGSLRAVVATNGAGLTYFIPGPGDAPRGSCGQPNDKTFELRELSCDPGRSLHALTVVSQLIALQKSAKDLPTSNVVRVLGQ
jgi:hypothetical protein